MQAQLFLLQMLHLHDVYLTTHLFTHRQGISYCSVKIYL